MTRNNVYLAKPVFAVVLVLIGAEWLSKSVAQELKNDSYEAVMRLSDEFERSGDTRAVTALAKMVRSDFYGLNAEGALTLLARKVKRKQVESEIIPSLVWGLNSTNANIRCEAAIALSEYSRYVAPVVPALINFLNNSQDVDKRRADYFAIEALGRVGQEASPAIPTLLKIIDWHDANVQYFGDSSPRAAAASAIDLIGFSDTTTQLRLEKALTDRNPHVKCASASALIDNKFISEAVLETLSRTIVTNDITFTLEPVTLQLIRGATTNANPSIQEAARALLKKLPN